MPAPPLHDVPATGSSVAAASRAPAGAWRRRLAESAADERRQRQLAWALFGLLALVLVRTAWVSDDAYISLRTLDNFVHGFGLRWNVAERVQTFTHPLWLFVVGLFYGVTREPFYTTLFVCLAVSLAAVLYATVRSGARPASAALGLLALLASRAFVDYSTSGLENPLVHLLLALFVVRLTDDAPDGRRLFELGLLAGLAALTRLDALLLFAPALIYALVLFRRRRGIGIVAAGFAPLLLWELFATVYYGLPYPNTALAKLGAGIPWPALARQGLFYLLNSLRTDPPTLVVVFAALAAAVVRRRGREFALAAGIVLHLLYVVRIGGDFMSGRFLSAPFFAAVLLLVQADFLAVRGAKPAFAAGLALLALATPHPSFLSGADYGRGANGMIDEHGVADERRYYFGLSGWLNGARGWTRPVAWATQDGREARRTGVPLLIDGAVGFQGYFAGPAAHFLDLYALGDPLRARLPAVERDPYFDRLYADQFGRQSAEGWRIGHFVRNVPRGYITTLLTGANKIEDPRLGRLYDRLAVVVRGPLWSAARLAEIVRLNLGRFEAPDDSARRPPFAPVDWDELIAQRPALAAGYVQRSKQLFAAGDRERGLGDLSRAIELDPRNLAALNALAARLLPQDPARALEYYERAGAADPGDPRPLLHAADILLAQGNPRRAIPLLERVIDADPRVDVAMYDLGLAHSLLGDQPQAAAWFEKALARNPDSAASCDALGYARLQLGDTSGASALFDKALALQPDLESALIHAANVRAMNGQRPAAIELLRRAIAVNPQNAEALFHLADLTEQAGDPQAALALWRRSASLGFDPARAALVQRGAAP